MIVNTSRTRLLCLGLIAAGLALSGHLFFRHLDLATAGTGHAGDFCSAVFGQGCDGALLSAVWALGIPAAGWGLVYYGALAALLLLGWVLGRQFESEAALAAFALSLGGALASVALLAFLLASRVPFCPLCGVAHLINFALVFALFRLVGRSWRGAVRGLAAAGRYLAGGAAADAPMARWKLVGFLSVGLVAVVAYQWVRVEVRLRGAEPTPFDPQRTLEAFERSEEHSIPVAPDDTVLGAANGAVRLVVFSDYQCPACARFSHEMSLLTEQFPQLQIVIKHFPLDTLCNGSLTKDLHPRACEAAWAVEAARRQDKFDEFLWTSHGSTRLAGDPRPATKCRPTSTWVFAWGSRARPGSC
jgi:uncharacterized membrane protein